MGYQETADTDSVSDGDANSQVENVGGVSGTLPASEATCMGQGSRQGCKREQLHASWCWSVDYLMTSAPDHCGLPCPITKACDSLHNSSFYPIGMDAASDVGIKCQLLGGLTGVWEIWCQQLESYQAFGCHRTVVSVTKVSGVPVPVAGRRLGNKLLGWEQRVPTKKAATEVIDWAEVVTALVVLAVDGTEHLYLLLQNRSMQITES